MSGYYRALNRKQVCIFTIQQSTAAVNVTLLAFATDRCAAVRHRSILLQRSLDGTDRQTDGHPTV